MAAANASRMPAARLFNAPVHLGFCVVAGKDVYFMANLRQSNQGEIWITQGKVPTHFGFWFHHGPDLCHSFRRDTGKSNDLIPNLT